MGVETGMCSLKGELSSLVVQALREIGKDKLTEDEEHKLISFLEKEKYKHLKHDIQIVPQWIGEILSKAIQ